MSYIVPDKLPTSCCGCHMFMHEEHDLYSIANHYAGYCRELSKYIDEDKFVKERHPDCTLIEVPPHGRLIDADKIDYRNDAMHDGTGHLVVADNFMNGVMWINDCIDNAPTVIEAEGEP